MFINIIILILNIFLYCHIPGYRQCPVRQQLSNATPISITLSTTRIGNQYPMNAASKTNASAHEQQPLKSSQS